MTAMLMMKVQGLEFLLMLTRVQPGVYTYSSSHSWIYIALPSIPEDPLPTYKAPAPALVLKSGTART